MAYDPNFINGHQIPLPIPNQRISRSVFGGDYIHHLRHSILFNQDRGFAFVSAHNIDGASLSAGQFTTRNFKNDLKIQPASLQVDNDRGYRKSTTHGFGPNPWDRGHLARRKSLSWGSQSQASIAERESDLWSNIAPQHENLHDDAWGNIEDWMLGRIESDGQRACVFTGPVFTDDDPEHKNGDAENPIRIPAGFWKVISVNLSGVMRSAGFLVWQRDYDSDQPLPFSPVLEQVRLTTIEVLTGLTFPTLRGFDPILFDRESRSRSLIASQARSELRKQILETRNSGASPDAMPSVDRGLLMKATAPGTSVISSMRDIIL